MVTEHRIHLYTESSLWQNKLFSKTNKKAPSLRQVSLTLNKQFEIEHHIARTQNKQTISGAFGKTIFKCLCQIKGAQHFWLIASS